MTTPRKPVPDSGGDHLVRNPITSVGDTRDEIVAQMRNLRAHGCEPGFRHVVNGPLRRPSGHAEHRARGR